VRSLNRAYWGSRFLCMVSLSCGLWKRYCSKEGLVYSQDLKSGHSKQNRWLTLDMYFEIKVQVGAFGCKESCSMHARCVLYIISRFLEVYLDSFHAQNWIMDHFSSTCRMRHRPNFICLGCGGPIRKRHVRESIPKAGYVACLQRVGTGHVRL
jgi:hypothetical protein